MHFLSFCLVVTVCVLFTDAEDDFLQKLKAAKHFAQDKTENILEEWQVSKYPGFLKSCFMHKSAWELLKLRYTDKIIRALNNTFSTAVMEPFVVSFLGSSVTAGHDSHVNMSFPFVVREYMAGSLSMMGVALQTRNMALGNNPCMPYDPCVSIFAGQDADIVHWEQSMNCHDEVMPEQFVRQATHKPPTRYEGIRHSDQFIPPLIVFSESFTAHWPASKCTPQPPQHEVTSDEKLLLMAAPVTIVSDLNKDMYHKSWSNFHDLVKHYKGAGIQMFTHQSHEIYACQGPYIPEWEKGAASWHPSVIAHRLRAAHHAYFWLLAWIEALDDFIKSAEQRSILAIAKLMRKHIAALPTNPTTALKNPLQIADGVACYSDYEPRAIRSASLRNRVIGGKYLPSADISATGNHWHSIIYENLVHENLVKQSLKMGYFDYKHLLYGDSSSGPISFLVTPNKPGKLFLCQTPGIWGQLPEGFVNLWDNAATFYVTTVGAFVEVKVEELLGFEFKEDLAVKQEIVYDKNMDICITFKDNVLVGASAITIVPTTSSKVMVAWIISP